MVYSTQTHSDLAAAVSETTATTLGTWLMVIATSRPERSRSMRSISPIWRCDTVIGSDRKTSRTAAPPLGLTKYIEKR